MSLAHKELVAVFDQMTLFTDDQVMRQLFTKEELRTIEMEVRNRRSEQSNRETVKYYQQLLKRIGKQILNECAAENKAVC